MTRVCYVVIVASHARGERAADRGVVGVCETAEQAQAFADHYGEVDGFTRNEHPGGSKTVRLYGWHKHTEEFHHQIVIEEHEFRPAHPLEKLAGEGE